MTPRIAPVSAPDEDQRERLSKTPLGADGQPLNLFATLAHRPQVMTRLNALGSTLMFRSPLAARERELAILRIAGAVGCGYEILHHRALGTAAGLTQEEIEAVLDPASPHLWSDDDRALMRVVDELALAADVSDAAWAGLGALEQDQRLELLVLVGFYRMLAGVIAGARVQPDDRTMGPDGRPR